MELPRDLRYTEYHQWVRQENNRVVVGLTDYAQENLGSIVYIFFSEVGMFVKEKQVIGEIESLKAVSLINSPLDGRICEINKEVIESPSLINQDPYGKGWLLIIEADNPGNISSLMNAEEYERFIREG
ncbi:MAG: glycine cleavage system protein GcvH [Candidatus Subteraquimicrobiales bacterium]|nr:glycine cleavage system protein GcvH [Candidatus Subteraquimicrobiales bacterium]